MTLGLAVFLKKILRSYFRMYFYVYMHPSVFAEAQRDGEEAQNFLTILLKGFLQNCFLSVFEDDRWDHEIKEYLNSWPSNMTRRKIMSVLVQFKKRNRLLFNITPDYLSKKTDLECVLEQASGLLIDLIVVDDEIHVDHAQNFEIATRKSYLHTNFETLRTMIENGKTCVPGDMDENDFLEYHFQKGIKYAQRVDICDHFFGSKNFSRNFRYTIKFFLEWLGNTLSDPENCEIVFHTGQSEGKGADYIEQEIRSYKKISLSSTKITLLFYEKLPHHRFILTNQIAMDIDRGMDFFDEFTRSCRDTRISYRDPNDALKVIKQYSGKILHSVSF